jgi:hypothetical protein
MFRWHSAAGRSEQVFALPRAADWGQATVTSAGPIGPSPLLQPSNAERGANTFAGTPEIDHGVSPRPTSRWARATFARLLEMIACPGLRRAWRSLPRRRGALFRVAFTTPGPRLTAKSPPTPLLSAGHEPTSITPATID